METNIKIFEKVLLIRETEKSLLTLFSEGKIHGTIHTCIGQELIGVCISSFLKTTDFIISNHRGHGHYISRTGDVESLIAELMGKVSGASCGFGGSQHLYHTNFLSSGIQGGMTPIGAGIALSFKIRNQNNIVIVFIGDGTLGEGIVYETLNLCAKWELPVLFVLENNTYAQSTSFFQTFMGTVKSRIEGFDINYFNTNTWDLEDLIVNSENAVDYVRKHIKPAFIEINTYRINPHSKGDDNRDPVEIELYKEKDLLNIFIKDHKEVYENMLQRIKSRINDSILLAEKNSNLTEINEDSFIIKETEQFSNLPVDSGRINDLIYEALRELFKADSEMIMIGEDIENTNKFTKIEYGGAFKVTKDLSTLFPGRVKNTPISEAAITGIATGTALMGIRSFVEIMFGDFLTLTFDQILNHATKFCSIYGRKISVPLIIRTPMGGKRGYGPTHSQSIEKFFLGIPNLTVIALNSRISPKLIFSNIISNLSNPVLVIENKVLYTRSLNTENPNGYLVQASNDPFPTIKISPVDKKPQITLVCYGEMLDDVERAMLNVFDEVEILCEVIAPTRICPLNITSIIDSVRITKNLIIVEEGVIFSAFGSEICAVILEQNIKINYVKRLGNNNIIPCSSDAEKDLVPNANKIFETIKSALYE